MSDLQSESLRFPFFSPKVLQDSLPEPAHLQQSEHKQVFHLQKDNEAALYPDWYPLPSSEAEWTAVL